MQSFNGVAFLACFNEVLQKELENTIIKSLLVNS